MSMIEDVVIICEYDKPFIKWREKADKLLTWARIVKSHNLIFVCDDNKRCK